MKDFLLGLPFYKDVIAFKVYVHLFLFSDEHGHIRTSLGEIANANGLTREQVRRAISRVNASGELSVTTDKQGTSFSVIGKTYHSLGDTQNNTVRDTRNDTVSVIRNSVENKNVKTSINKEANTQNNTLSTTTNNTPLEPQEKRTRFVKPTLGEVQAHIAEKGYHFDAESFMAYYESKGWKVGKSPMKSWKAACVTWERGRKETTSEEEPTKTQILNETLMESFPKGSSPYANFLHYIVENTENIVGSVLLPSEKEFMMINESYRPFFHDALLLMDGDPWLSKSTFWGAFIKAINQTKKALSNNDISKRQVADTMQRVRERIARAAELDSSSEDVPF